MFEVFNVHLKRRTNLPKKFPRGICKMSSSSSSQEDVQRGQSPSFRSTAYIFPRVNGHIPEQAAISTLTLLTGANTADQNDLLGTNAACGKPSTSPNTSKKFGSGWFGRNQPMNELADLQEQHAKGHTFIIQNFKKATFCDCCQRLLLDYQRHGLRCRICKLNIHENCLPNMAFCNGRPLGAFGFSRRTPSEGSQESLQRDPSVDAVYKILQQGRVLRMSDNANELLTMDMPTSSTSPNAEVFERTMPSNGDTAGPKKNPSPSTSQGTSAAGKPKESATKRNEKTSIPEGKYTYIAMYKFEPREKDDLALRVGDKINVIKDKDDAWWLGECQNKTGYFPAKFVAKMRTHEIAYTAHKVTLTNDSLGREVLIKKNQIIFANPCWPVKRENYLYCRIGAKEGFVAESDITPVQ